MVAVSVLFLAEAIDKIAEAHGDFMPVIQVGVGDDRGIDCEEK